MHRKNLFLIAAATVAFATTTASADHTFYVGMTDLTFAGDSGLFAKHRACSKKFEGGRMCTTQMIIEGGADPWAQDPYVDQRAWVNPTPVGPGPVSVPEHEVTDFDGSGGEPSDMSCSNWRSDDSENDGKVIEAGTLYGGLPDGGIYFNDASCKNRLQVACCSHVPLEPVRLKPTQAAETPQNRSQRRNPFERRPPR